MLVVLGQLLLWLFLVVVVVVVAVLVKNDDDDDDGDVDVDDAEDVDLTSGGGIDSHQLFQRLTQDPQFQQLRTVIQANPTLLESLLNQLKDTNPMIYNVIMENRDEFSRWLTEGSSGSTGPAPGSVPMPGPDSDSRPPMSGAPAGQPARRIQLDLTPEDRAAIHQLVEMGFDEGESLQAYIACEKNLQLAANLLMGGF